MNAGTYDDSPASRSKPPESSTKSHHGSTRRSRMAGPEAEDTLCGLESQPFPPPQQGNTIAVKVIPRTGAEMTTTVEQP